MHQQWHLGARMLVLVVGGLGILSASGDEAEPETGAAVRIGVDRPLFAWANGRDPVRAHRADGTPVFPTPTQPAPRGAALLDRPFALRVEEGAFVEPRLAGPVADAIRSSGELFVMATITHRGGDGPILAIASDRQTNFSLLAANGHLAVRWRHGADHSEHLLEDVPLPPETPVHLAVAIGGGALTVHRDGMPVASRSLAWDPSSWEPLPLVLGQTDPAGGPWWRGRIEHAVLHHRIPAPADIRAAAEAARAGAAGRSNPAPLVLDVRLVEAPAIPHPAETVYPRSYAVGEYEVLAVREGRFDGQRIRIGRWTELDNRPLAAARMAAGGTATLRVEPIGAHPHLDTEEVFDTPDPDLDLPVYFDVGPVPFAPTAD